MVSYKGGKIKKFYVTFCSVYGAQCVHYYNIMSANVIETPTIVILAVLQDYNIPTRMYTT